MRVDAPSRREGFEDVVEVAFEAVVTVAFVDMQDVYESSGSVCECGSTGAEAIEGYDLRCDDAVFTCGGDF